jgi:hypothetical protein
MIRDLPTGGRAYAETHFIDFVRKAFSNVSGMQWSSDPEVSRVHITSNVGETDVETLPRIVVSVGDLQDFGGSIGNLKSWSETSSRFVHVDQSFVSIVCFSEVEQEASDMAYFVRRMMMAARDDFRARGIFGIRNPQVSQGAPNVIGTIKDYVYASTVQAGFMYPSNEVIDQSESLPFLESIGGVVFKPGEGAFPRPGDAGWNPSEFPEEVEITSSEAFEQNGKVCITLKSPHPLHPYRPTGIKVWRGPVEMDAVCVGDPHDDFGLIVEVQTPFKYGLRCEYVTGDIVSAASGNNLLPFSITF